MSRPTKRNGAFKRRVFALDGEQCRNPFHAQVIKDLIAIGLLFLPVILRFVAHHIRYRSKRGQVNHVENGIMLCQFCHHAAHNGHGKGEERVIGRVFMLRVLNALGGTPDDRWSKAREELRKRYGEAA